MKATKAILSELRASQDERVFTRRYFLSKGNPPVEYEVKVLYGGSLEKPNLSCTCPRFTFGKWCGHAEQVWRVDFDEVSRRMCVERDAIYKAHGWNDK